MQTSAHLTLTTIDEENCCIKVAKPVCKLAVCN